MTDLMAREDDDDAFDEAEPQEVVELAGEGGGDSESQLRRK